MKAFSQDLGRHDANAGSVLQKKLPAETPLLRLTPVGPPPSWRAKTPSPSPRGPKRPSGPTLIPPRLVRKDDPPVPVRTARFARFARERPMPLEPPPPLPFLPRLQAKSVRKKIGPDKCYSYECGVSCCFPFSGACSRNSNLKPRLVFVLKEGEAERRNCTITAS